MKTIIYLAVCLALVGNGLSYVKDNVTKKGEQYTTINCNQSDCSEL